MDKDREISPSDPAGNDEWVFPLDLRVMANLSTPLLLRNGAASFPLAYRFFSDEPVLIEFDKPGSLNVGARLFKYGRDGTAFEDRLIKESKTIRPETWCTATLTIKAEPLVLNARYRLDIGIVRENRYWFAEKGGNEFRFDVSFTDHAVEPNGSERLAMVEDELTRLKQELAALQSKSEETVAALGESSDVARQLDEIRSEIRLIWKFLDPIRASQF